MEERSNPMKKLLLPTGDCLQATVEKFYECLNLQDPAKKENCMQDHKQMIKDCDTIRKGARLVTVPQEPDDLNENLLQSSSTSRLQNKWETLIHNA